MSFWQTVFVLSNLGITLGYLFVAVSVAPYLEIPSRSTRVAGVTFFVTCSFTHLDHAVTTAMSAYSVDFAAMAHTLLPWHAVLNHVVQVVAVWVFVTGLYRQFNRRSAAARRALSIEHPLRRWGD